jgi:hypothetical protein
MDKVDSCILHTLVSATGTVHHIDRKIFNIQSFIESLCTKTPRLQWRPGLQEPIHLFHMLLVSRLGVGSKKGP